MYENVLYYGGNLFISFFSVFAGISSDNGAFLDFTASSCLMMPFSPISRV